MKDKKYIYRFLASISVIAVAYKVGYDYVQSQNVPVIRPYMQLTAGDNIDPASAPVVTKFDEATAKEFAIEMFADVEAAPDFNEFLSRFYCGSCGKRCLLASPRCSVGNKKQDKVITVYQEIYPEAEIV